MDTKGRTSSSCRMLTTAPSLTALAHEAGDTAKLRKDGLSLIKTAFLDARAIVKADVEPGR